VFFFFEDNFNFISINFTIFIQNQGIVQ